MCTFPHQRHLRIERLGRVPYGPMAELQRQRHAAVAADTMDDTLFLLEHEPVITLGRNGNDSSVLASASQLAAHGVQRFVSGRGGDATYHGPGQIVGYPILQLQDDERDIKRYAGLLEELMIRTLRDFDIHARRLPEHRGVWVDGAKIGAIGVRVAQWTTRHGFALNVATDLGGFELIVPCGIRDRSVTSMAQLLPQTPPLAEVEDRLILHAAYLFDRRTYDAEATALPTVVDATEPVSLSPATTAATPAREHHHG